MTRHCGKIYRFRLYNCLLTAMTCLAALVVVSLMAIPASASLPIYKFGADTMDLTSIAAAPNGGFWVQVDASHGSVLGKSRTLAIDGAPQFESVPVAGTIVAYPRGVGYWVVGGDGHIYARGDAPELCGGYLGNCAAFPPPATVKPYTIVAAAATPDGQGFWALGQNYTVYAVGDAPTLGTSIGGQQSPPTAIVATPSGRGYYILLADGGVFTYGDAKFYGSTGGKKQGGHDATGLALSYDASGTVDGYWMVFDDGGVFTFGQAPFLGSTGGKSGGSPVTSITARPNRLGYAWVHDTGGVELSHLPRVVITSKQFGTVIGPLYGGTEPGTPLQLLEANGRTSQQWEVRPTSGVAESGSIVQLVNFNNGLCADVTGVGPHDAKLIQWPCKTSAQGWQNQIWRITFDPNGATQFVYSGVYVNEPNYTLAGDSSGTLSLQPSGVDNPGWILTGAQ